MSRPIIPRPLSDNPEMSPPSISQKARKISNACTACKQRKTKCSGTTPCDACSNRGGACVYDAASDQRRKIMQQRALQDLVETQAALDRNQQFLGGMIATFRVGDTETSNDLLAMIRSEIGLAQLGSYVANTRRSNPMIEEAFRSIDFTSDAQEGLPSPMQILTSMTPQHSSTIERPALDGGSQTLGSASGTANFQESVDGHV